MSYPTQNLPSTPEDPPSRKRTKKRRGLAGIVVVAMLGTAVLAGGGLYLGGVFATSIVAEPFDSPGVDPFGPSTGDGQSVPITPVAQIRDEAAAAPPAQPTAETPARPAVEQVSSPQPPPDRVLPGPVAAAPTPATTLTGNTVGLYGGTNKNACNADQLIAFLRANPDKARAWADVERVPADQIEAFVRTLTPVILRTDTAVINHGFRNNVANPFPAVLQAGTAVMVDQFGVPRVRCKCGNPLLPPVRHNQATYSGTKWLGFDERNITYIERSPQPVTVFRLARLCQCGYGPAAGAPVGLPQSAAQSETSTDGTTATGQGTPRRPVAGTGPSASSRVPAAPDAAPGTAPSRRSPSNGSSGSASSGDGDGGANPGSNGSGSNGSGDGAGAPESGGSGAEPGSGNAAVPPEVPNG